MNRVRTVLLIAGCALALPALAQETDPPPEPETPAVEPAEAQNEGDAGLGNLDDLLGLDGDDEEADASDDAEALPEGAGVGEIELERALTEQEAREALVQAAQQMKEAGFRMGEVEDSGVVTQRLHQEIITKLDVLIRFAEQQQQQQSSSSQQQQQQSQSQQQQQQNQQQQQGQRQQQSQQAGEMSGEPQDGMHDLAFEEGRRDVIDSSSAGWGDLPQRVRERLVEGSSDYFSTLYEALTEAYYRRLAEEASR